MMQIVEQSDSEKFSMYDKLSKEELIHMLIEANKHLNRMTPTLIPAPYPYPSPFWQAPCLMNPICLPNNSNIFYTTSTGATS